MQLMDTCFVQSERTPEDERFWRKHCYAVPLGADVTNGKVSTFATTIRHAPRACNDARCAVVAIVAARLCLRHSQHRGH